MEKKIEDKVQILQYANTTHYNQVMGRARGLSPSANGFVDFAGPSTNLMNYGPASTRKLLSGSSRIVNMVYLKHYEADFTEADILSGILLNRLWTNTTWHHHEILGIMVLAPQRLHKNLYHVGGVYFWKVMNGVTRDYKKNPAHYDEEGRPR